MVAPARAPKRRGTSRAATLPALPDPASRAQSPDSTRCAPSGSTVVGVTLAGPWGRGSDETRRLLSRSGGHVGDGSGRDSDVAAPPWAPAAARGPDDAIDVRRRHPGSPAVVSSKVCTALRSTRAESEHLGERLAQGEAGALQPPPRQRCGAGGSAAIWPVSRGQISTSPAEERPARIDTGERTAQNALLAVALP